MFHAGLPPLCAHNFASDRAAAVTPETDGWAVAFSPRSPGGRGDRDLTFEATRALVGSPPGRRGRHSISSRGGLPRVYYRDSPMTHAEQTHTVRTADALELVGKVWHPDPSHTHDGQPKGTVCLIHGFGEHVERYHHVADRMNAAGYLVAGVDLRGHGKSAGRRGYTPSIDQLLDDVVAVKASVRALAPAAPLFLYGHSMGGNIGLNFLLRRTPTLTGAIITSPWLRLTKPPGAALAGLVKLLNTIAPKIPVPNKLEKGGLSRDPDVEAKYNADPLVHGLVTPRLFTEIRDAGEWAISNAGKLAVPTLLFHGEADPITSCEGSAAFADAAPSDTLSFRPWPNLRHETHNEPEQGEVIDAMITFMNDKIAEA